MRAAFLGTPAAAVPSLAALLDVADVPLVVTQPDRARGRSGRPSPSPVKLAALDWGLPVAQPDSAGALRHALEGGAFDVGVVVAYGRILKPDVLASTRAGFVNVHFSLLPRWRGAAPVERAMLAGDEMVGVSLMQLDEGMDTGPVISVLETPVADDETGGTLTARLAHLGAVLLAESLEAYMAGSLHPAAQISAGATYAARLRAEEARLDPRMGAAEMSLRVRAFTPRPGAWIPAEGDRIKVVSAYPAGDRDVETGLIVMREAEVLLGTSRGALGLETIQPPGKRPVPARDWMNGRRGAPLRVDS
jgi:methionyl-tRNA formyltransferase